MADIARIEERIDRVAVGAMEVSDALGGLRFQNMVEVMEFAKMMSVAGNAVPKHLQGNPGMCLAVCVQALEWRFSPFAVANKSYEVQNRLSFESQLVHAVIEQRAPITGRLRHKFDGEGDDRRCIVTAILRETGETLEYISPPISKITPKNSPLWKTKPDLQLYYNTSRDFCRVYFPDVLLGVYAEDELRDHVGPDHAKDVTDKPGVASRLKGSKGRGFSAAHVERETTRGVIDESTSQTEAQREAGDKPPPPASTGDEPKASAQGSGSPDSGATDQPHGVLQSPQSNASASADAGAAPSPESPASPNSSQGLPAPQLDLGTKPAPEVVPPVAGAGATTSSTATSGMAPVDEPKQASEPGTSALHGSAGLPPGFLKVYAKGLGAATNRPKSLQNCHDKVLPTLGAEPSEDDLVELRAVYGLFKRHLAGEISGEHLAADLRELGAA